MIKQHKDNTVFIKLILVIILAIIANGCALGVTPVVIKHDPIMPVLSKKEGTILVKQFVDNRKDVNYIGNKRNAFGMVLGHIGTTGGQKIETILTNCFADALTEAGYKAVVEEGQSKDALADIKFDATVEGTINEFWLDLYMATWHYMTVELKAFENESEKMFWEKEIKSEEKNVLWIGATAEYEKVIRQSLTKSLNQVAQEFASDEFYNKLHKDK